MINISYIIGLIDAATTYTVASARAKEPDLLEFSTLPVVFVGYSSIDSASPTSPMEHDLYSMAGDDLVQSFDIQIICAQADLPTIWKAVYTCLVGQHPTPTVSGLASTSGLTYSQGGMIGLANDRVFWLDRWRIGFPTTNASI